jgi:muramoyltetrapeptide carboxypeptidase
MKSTLKIRFWYWRIWAKSPIKIDRMLTQLKQAGKLDGICGMVFGEMLNCINRPDQGYTLEEVVPRCSGRHEFSDSLWISNRAYDRSNVVVPLGVRAKLSLGSNSRFQTLEPAVTVL